MAPRRLVFLTVFVVLWLSWGSGRNFVGRCKSFKATEKISTKFVKFKRRYTRKSRLVRVKDGKDAKDEKFEEFVKDIAVKSSFEGNPKLAERPEVWNGTYSDNAFDIAMTTAFRAAMGAVAGWQSSKPFIPSRPGESYEGLVEVAQALQWGKGAHAFEEAILDVLARFPRSPQLLQNNKVSMELLAFLTPRLFAFLVGPSKVEDWDREDGETWRSAVKIEKCRFLTQSNCAGMCVGLCQRPTQRFFTEVANLPLAMEPNFTDCSCTMTWGKQPLPRETDPAGTQSCFQWCPTAVGVNDKIDKMNEISSSSGGNLVDTTSEPAGPPCPRITRTPPPPR